MNLHVLQHESCETPGVIADWALERGHALTFTHLYRGESLPDSAAVDGLVVMGGPMNIYQDRLYPWLAAERRFLEAHVAAGKPAVGICLGAQLLADALGGRVHQNAEIEIGWFPVEFTAEARARFPFLPPTLEALHWHGDTFELPAGATRLATSAGCANQGFVFGDRVLALQFHPEVKPGVVADLVEAFAHELAPAAFVQSAEQILAASESTYATAHGTLRALLDATVGA